LLHPWIIILLETVPLIRRHHRHSCRAADLLTTTGSMVDTVMLASLGEETIERLGFAPNSPA
jgi:hypothetical protein